MLHRILVSAFFLSACVEADDPIDPADTASHNPANPDGEGPAPVELGDPGVDSSLTSYALLAKTGVTNVTGSSISGGDIGVSPAAASYITGFALVMDPSNEFSTSVSVVPPGVVLAADYADPTPSVLTTSIGEMEAAYTDAAGRTHPDELNLGDGNLGGLTLAPGLYTWGSSVTLPTDLTLSGGATDVWILQISGDLSVATDTSVLLSGGAEAENVFWQVAGEVTVHEGAHLEGVLLAQTGITLQTNASLNGRALAQTMIALDDNLVTTP